MLEVSSSERKHLLFGVASRPPLEKVVVLSLADPIRNQLTLSATKGLNKLTQGDAANPGFLDLPTVAARYRWLPSPASSASP